MLNKNWFYVIAALILLSVGLSLRTAYLGEAYKAAKASAAQHGTKAEAAEAQVKATLREKSELQAENVILKLKLEGALAKIPKVTPKPEVPTGLGEVEAQLLTAGLPSKVLEVTPNTLALPGARMVLSWRADALQVPKLEGALAGTERALEASQAVTAGLERELSTTELAFQQRGIIVQERTLQVADLTTANRKLEMKLTTTVFNNKLVLGVSIPVVLYLGYRLGRK